MKFVSSSCVCFFALCLSGGVWAQELIVGADSNPTNLIISSGISNYNTTVIGVTPDASNNGLLIINSGTILNNADSVYLGALGSGNNLTLSNGASLTAVNTNSIGYDVSASNNSMIVTDLGSTVTSSETDVGFQGSSNSLAIVNGGAMTNVDTVVGYYSTANSNLLTVSGASSILNNSGDSLYVGVDGNFNRARIDNGGAVLNSSATYLGLDADASGNILKVDGSATSLINGDSLYVGYAGSSNKASITGGATVHNDSNTIVGSFTGASNNRLTVSGDSSILSNGVSLIVGDEGNNNSMLISNGGSVLVGDSLVIGNTASGASNVIQIDGATSLLAVTNGLYVGSGGSSSNTLVVTNGATVTGSILYIGYGVGADNNAATVSGTGSSITLINNLIVGGNTNSRNSLVVAGGGVATSASSWIGLNGGALSQGNSALVTGSNSLWAISGGLIVGDGSWNNSLTLSNRATLSTVGDLSISANNNSIAGGASNNSLLVTDLASLRVGGNLTVGQSGSGTLTLGNGGSVTATTLYVASQSNSIGTVNIGGISGSDSAGSIGVGTIVFGAGSGTLNFNQRDTATLNAVLNSGLSGNGSLNQSGSGTTILAGNNGAFYGKTTISGGKLQIDGLTSAWVSPILNNAALSIDPVNGSTMQVIVPITGTGSFTVAGGGTVVLLGTNAYLGETSINGSSLQVGINEVYGTLGAGPVSMANSSSSIVFDRSDSVAISNAISGSGTLVQAGSGTLILTGNNTYSGGTVIANNTLQVGNGGTSGSVGSGTVTLSGEASTIIFNRSDSFTLLNSIKGSGNILQEGSGTVELSGSNNVAGTVAVDGGSLVISGSLNGVDKGVYVGKTVGNSVLIITNRGNNTAGYIGIGNSTTSGSNSVIIDGASLTLDPSQGFLTVGTTNNSSGNALIIRNAGSVTSQFGSIGYNGSSSNTALITGSGSSWTVIKQNWFYVGDQSDNNSVLISNSAKLTTFNQAYIGGSSLQGGTPGFNNSVLVSDRAFWSNSGAITVGGGGSGTLTVAGEGSITADTINLSVNAGSSGTLNIGGFHDAGNAGTLNVSQINFGAGTGILNFNQSDTSFFTSSLYGVGTLNQLGAGTTILSGNGSSFSGTTAVHQGTLLINSSLNSTTTTIYSGTLKLGANGTLTSSSVNIGTRDSMGTLDLTSKGSPGFTFETGQTLAGSGSISLSTGAILQVNGNLGSLVNGPEQINVAGGIALGGNSTTVLNVAGTNSAGKIDGFSQVNAFGDFTAGGNLVLDILNGESITPTAPSMQVFKSLSLIGNFLSVQLDGCYTGTLTYYADVNAWQTWNAPIAGTNPTGAPSDNFISLNMNTGVLTVVPEPSSNLLIVLGGLAMFVAFRIKGSKARKEPN